MSHVQHLATLLFLSYRYSQGAIGTQNRMLLYIEQHYHPDIFDIDRQQELLAGTRKLVEPYFLSDQHHPATAIPWDEADPASFHKSPQLVTNELAGLFERFRTREELESFDASPEGICKSLIIMDADYLRRQGGRAGSSTPLKVRVSPYTRDAYNSLFIKHGILGSSTRTTEFDTIFAEAADESVILKQEKFTLRVLQDVVSLYQEHHSAEAGDERLIQLATSINRALYV